MPAQVVVLRLRQARGRFGGRQVAELGAVGIGRRIAGPGAHFIGALETQPIDQSALEQTEDLALQEQPHLGLGRVHVDVDLADRHLQEGDDDGMAAGGDRFAVGLRDGLREGGTVDRTAVDVDVLLFAVATGPGRARGQAADAEAALGVLEPRHVADHRGAQQVARAIGQRRRRPQVQQRVGLGPHQPSRIGVGQGQLRQQAHDRALLGLARLHELAPGRRVVEQIADGDGGAAVAGRRFTADDLATLDLDHPAGVRGRRAADAAHPADRGDARERFTAESERADAHDVGGRGDLAGGVALEGQRQVAEGHAVAVVIDRQRGQAAVLQSDRNLPGAGVEAVLDELLDDRRRTLDHLAGGDAVDRGAVEHPDPAGFLCHLALHAVPGAVAVGQLGGTSKRPRSRRVTVAGRGVNLCGRGGQARAASTACSSFSGVSPPPG